LRKEEREKRKEKGFLLRKEGEKGKGKKLGLSDPDRRGKKKKRKGGGKRVLPSSGGEKEKVAFTPPVRDSGVVRKNR